MADFLLACAQNHYNMWNGGKDWSGWAAYISFFRHVAKLDLPEYEKWQHYEAATLHGGPRIMHPDFCMVSDRPEFIHLDERNRPHCPTGPFCRWRDGWALYYWHGVRVPGYVIERPEEITVAAIDAEQNAEVRRVMLDRFPGGIGEFIRQSGAKVLDHNETAGIVVDQSGNVVGKGSATLFRREVADDEPILMVKVRNSTTESDGSFKDYWLRCHPECRALPMRDGDSFDAPQELTARNAVASLFGMTGEEYRPLVET